MEMNQHLSLMTAPKPGALKSGRPSGPRVSSKFWFGLLSAGQSGFGGSVFLKVIANVSFADGSFRPSFRDT